MIGYSVRIATSDQDLDALLPFWQANAKDLETAPEYFRLVLTLRDSIRSPYVVVVEADGAPVAMMLCRIEDTILPAQFAYTTVMRHKLRTLITIYNGVIGQIDATTVGLIAGALRAAVDDGTVEMVKALGVHEGSLLETALNQLDLPARRVVRNPFEVHRLLELPDTIDTVLAMRSSSNRKRLRRYARRIEEMEGFRYEVITTADNLDQLMQDIEVVAARTFQRSVGGGFFNTPEWKALLKLGFDQGWLTIWMVYGEGKPLTYAGGYAYAGVFHSYLKGYDPDYGSQSIGTYLLLRMIADLIARGDTRSVDYGFGDAEYKQLFSTQSWQERNHMIFAPGARMAYVATSVRVIKGASNTAQRLVRKWDLEARLKKILRKKKAGQ